MTDWPNNETLSRLDDLLAAPAGRRFGVLGLGVVGRAMAASLAQRGAVVVGADRREEVAVDDLRELGVELRLGPTDEQTFADVEALAVSPGAHPEQPAVRAVVARRAPIFGELELCGELPARVIAITGTNGKSTTTALIGALLAGCGVKTFVGGNLGDPVIAWRERDEAVEVAVIELSSYQLETAYRFAPEIGVILNVTPDHADRYDGMEHYARTKQRLIEKGGVAILSYDDPRVRAMAGQAAGPVWFFSTAAESVPGDGAALRGDQLLPSGEAVDLGEIDLSHPLLCGRHNRENALAALLAVHALRLPAATPAALTAAYLAFGGLEHRLEMVAELDGVRFINDSKATNDESAATALRAMDRPVLLLLGGRDKGAGYEQVKAAATDRVRRVIAFGEARQLISAALAESLDVVQSEEMFAALSRARAEAQPGETVLLSPACSSFDQFANFEQRGRAFKDWVHREEKAG